MVWRLAAALVAACLESEPASAAVSAPLLASTVRTATLASFSGLRTGSITTEVGGAGAPAVTSLLLGRVAQRILLSFFCSGSARRRSERRSWGRHDRCGRETRARIARGHRGPGGTGTSRGPRFWTGYGDPLPPGAMASPGARCNGDTPRGSSAWRFLTTGTRR